MFWLDLLFAVVVTILIVAILMGAFGWGERVEQPPMAAGLFLFFVILLAVWAGGIWLTPMGPIFYGAYWVPFIFFGIFMLLLLIAAAPGPRRPRTPAEAAEQEQVAAASATAFGVFFWMLLIALLIAIVARYLWLGEAGEV